ncbi:MAG: hypothetical protein RL226_1046, partial [Bacteroidota bacterium]
IHSKGCGSSEKVKNLLVKGWDLTTISPWSFDILQYPQVSTSVLNTFGFEYAYPQVLLIVNGEIVNQSVGDSISVELIRSWVTP